MAKAKTSKQKSGDRNPAGKSASPAAKYDLLTILEAQTRVSKTTLRMLRSQTQSLLTTIDLALAEL